MKFSLDIIGVISVIGSNKLPEKSSKLLAKYFDKDVFRDKLIQKLDCEGFFISLYGLRYCLYSLKNENNKKNFYTSLFHYNENKLPANKGQIPGCEPVKNKKKFINMILTKRMIDKVTENNREKYLEKFQIIIDIRYLVLKFILDSYLFFSECLEKLHKKKKEIFPYEKEEILINIMKKYFI